MCENNLCQPTCVNPLTLLTCDAICTPGCICLPGYIRNTKNACVQPENCGKYYNSIRFRRLILTFL